MQCSLSRVFHFFRDMLFTEKRCIACAHPFVPPRSADSSTLHFVPGYLFCPACLPALQRQEQGYCPHCGEPSAWPLLPPAPCGRCVNTPPPWAHFFFHGRYEGLLRDMLLHLKFHQQPALGHVLGSLLALHPFFSSLSVDCVAPVPLHPHRLARRGYNQALEIARPIAKILDFQRLGSASALVPHLLRRHKPSIPQSGLSREQRRLNTHDIFTADPAIAFRHVLIVDDVFTTGATLIAACQAALRAKAASVSVAVVGRTPWRGARGGGQ